MSLNELVVNLSLSGRGELGGGNNCDNCPPNCDYMTPPSPPPPQPNIYVNWFNISFFLFCHLSSCHFLYIFPPCSTLFTSKVIEIFSSYRMRNGTSIWRFLKTRPFMYVSNVSWTDLQSQITFFWRRRIREKSFGKRAPSQCCDEIITWHCTVLRNRFGRVTMSF